MLRGCLILIKNVSANKLDKKNAMKSALNKKK